MIVAVFPGRFDPLTHGHMDIIRRASGLFNQVIVGVRLAPDEKLLFSLSERLKMVEHATKDIPNTLVVPCREHPVEFAQKYHAQVIIRGLRSFSEFEKELERAKLNKELASEIETIFITCRPELFYTSEMVKEIAYFGGNIDYLVPPLIKTQVYKKICLTQEQKEAVK